MADVSGKLKEILALVEYGEYFIINRPRQYGKTTTLYSIESTLMAQGDYLVFNISFEGIGDDIFKKEQLFAPGFISLLQSQAEYHTPELVPFLEALEQETDSLKTLSRAIANLVSQTEKRVVLLIDEVDKSSNNQLFISFLAMLRNKYLEQDRIKTFHSVVLAGVHDVKTLKVKIRPDAEQKLSPDGGIIGGYNSPWNIAAEFKVDMNLYPYEIKPMLDEYVVDRDVKMDTQHIAETLFYYTSGYPFLVSKLCKMLDEGDSPLQNAGEWTDDDLEIAVQQLTHESNTNFDSLTKNIESYPELYNMVYRVAIDGESFPFNPHNPTTNLGVLFGIFVNKDGLKIHNRIYNEVLVNYMAFKILETQFPQSNLAKTYKNNNRSLNMEAVLLGFQSFMKKEYSKKDRDFLEKNGRLVFLAFIKPIINGGGYDFQCPRQRRFAYGMDKKRKKKWKELFL